MKRLVLILLLSGSAYCQLWTGILAPARATDWSSAGATISNPSTQCGATIAPYSGTAAAINSSIQNPACSGKYIQLGAGTFNLSTGLNLGTKSNVVLRGMGANQTFLVFTGNDPCGGVTSIACFYGSMSLYNHSGFGTDNLTTWTATSYGAGQDHITLASTTNLSVGSIMVLDQCNDGLSGANCTGTEVDTGNAFVCDLQAAPCASHDGESGGQRVGRAQMQIVRVTNIAGLVVTFAPALRMPNWAAARSPGAFWPTTHAENVGIENMSIDFTAAGSQSGIVLWNCYNCWVKGIRSVYSTHNANGQRNHIWLLSDKNITIRDSYFYGSASLHSEGYGVEDFGCSDCLVENNIMQNMPSPQMINSACSGCVVGYNYSINDANDQQFMFNPFTLHGGGQDNVLAEGNIGNSYRQDYFHGSHNFNTAFRNYYNGWESGQTNGRTAGFVNSQGRYVNFVGNIFGRAGFHTGYEGTSGDGIIYTLGNGDGGFVPFDPLVESTMMRWGNWDTVTNNTRFCTANANPIAACTADERGDTATTYPALASPSSSFPASFYYSSKPSWFGSTAWPPIGPDVAGATVFGSNGTTTWATQSVGGHVNPIPAMSCYKDVMGGPADGTGAVLTFNASTCYVSNPIIPSTTPAPAPAFTEVKRPRLDVGN